MALIRRCLALLVTLAVIFTGAETAVARAEMAAAVYPVLCGEAGSAAEPLAFDVTGRPIAPHHTCPHCLAAGGLALALPPPQVAWTSAPTALNALCLPATAPHPASQARLRPAATGPPFLI
jgi:hypothetical protein